jgi:carboxylesterase type B
MEQSWPLFHKAIVQSGAFPSWGAHSWEAALRNYDRTIRGLACDAASGFATEEQQISCLTAKDWQDVATAGASVGVPCRDGCPWAPVVDGVELVDFPMRRVEEGQHATGKPLIMTSTEDDGATYRLLSILCLI